MGTLTGDTPALAEHCPHKLPTSCRLTATPLCCACQDKRAHSPYYSTYVDGVGLVMRGTRWQRYCWFCKEFWANRVAATEPRIDPKDTKVPDVPDQSDFLTKWFDFHRGFRVIRRQEDGSEQHEQVHCEKPWRDVAPGHLPLQTHFESVIASRQRTQPTTATAHVSLDETIDSLLEEATGFAQSVTEQAHPRRETRSRRQRHMPPSDEEVRDARARLAEAEERRTQIASQLATAEQELRNFRRSHAQLTQAQQTARNMERVFGTREEFQQQGANYVSPLTDMFTRAYDRYRIAEEVREQERNSNENEHRHRQLLAAMDGQSAFQQALHQARQEIEEQASAELGPQSLDDARIERPPPKTEEQMTVSLACRICLQQIADTAVLPCGHLVMCSYCAAIAVPTKDDAQTQPARRSAACPQCRKTVKRLAKIYTA